MTINIDTKAHLELLGHKAKDKVTGYSGVVTSVSFDLYGCAQAAITPLHDKTEKKDELAFGHWFDTKRIETFGSKVMEAPVFDAPSLMTPQQSRDSVRGPADKPAATRIPMR